MLNKKYGRLAISFFALILLGSLSTFAAADEIIDDISVHADANGDVDAVVKFIVPIQYLRHFPQGKSPFTSIYFNILGSVPADMWQDYESHRTPPSDIVQDIMVSTRDRATGPKVLIKFYRPAEFTVTMGKNNQVLLIHIKPGTPQQKNESKPAAGAAATSLAAIPLAVLPSIAKVPAIATPSVSLPSVSATSAKPVASAPVTPAPVAVAPVAPTPVAPAPVAPAPVAAVVPAPAVPVVAASVPVPAAPALTAKQIAAAAAPVAPSGDVTAPKVVLTQSQLKPTHIPLGGKDGLPDFPDIDQVVPQKVTPPSEKPTLADQITKANNQAGPLMEKGGRAILVGQTFAAIESFNSVLNLPPNKYSQDAQLWIAIAKERSGQLPKAILEYNTYLKLYPDGNSAKWIKDRLDRLKLSQPVLFNVLAKPASPALIQNTEFQYSEFGSLSMYYYQGASQTNTTATVGVVQTPSSFSSTDQKSLITNVNVMARSYNNEYDNRLVFQNFFAANFLPGQKSNDRLGAAYYEMKDRIVNYSVKVGRQSGFGGGVMGRFDGVSAGYGFFSDYKANVVVGRLIDFSREAKPTFNSVSLDFGTRSPLGGSVYFTNQRVQGVTDRRAVGGNLRYFEQRFNVMSMLDYDVQFKALNMFTVQGTLNGSGVGATDYNFLLDRRRSPVLDIRNAVNGTTTTVPFLLQNGWTMSDLILLADQRTSTTNLAQVGMTNHLSEKWIIGTDFTASNTAGMPQSGGPVDPTIGCVSTEGCLAPTPPTGVAWTISERLTGMGVIKPNDVTNFSLSYTKSQLTTAENFQVSNHSDLQEKWTLDSALHLGFQSDSSGGKVNDLSPSVRVSYRVRNDLSCDAQLGLDWNKSSSSVLNSSSRSFREFVAFGFTLNF